MVAAECGGVVFVVGDGDDGGAACEEFADEVDEFCPGSCVLAEGGFVEDEDFGCGGECGGYGESSFFAAGEGEGVRVK